MTEEERREMMRSNCAAQLSALGYGPDGMALPKTNKPHVLTYEEIQSHAGRGIQEGCFWLETRYGALAPVFIDLCFQGEVRMFSPFLTPDNYETWWKTVFYGDTWRCWSEKPTAEQREAESWS